MKIVMTMMVRDEIDIVAPMIEHHLAQGVDLIMVTDNGSVDGTTQLLERYAELGVVELAHDPVHRKQQGVVVTAMARRASTEHGADWVINADADEFYVPLDRSLTIREALERTDPSLSAFTVPVVNLVGPPADEGSGIARLVWRDHRSEENLTARGLHAHPTPNAIHVGDPEVTVAQGNHFVSLPSHGQPPTEVGLEVLHLPWRSYGQFERKVLHAGRAYSASPDLRPSKNHHGMADYRRAQQGRLREAFALRLPTVSDLESSDQYTEDTWLRDRLLETTLHARLPDALEAALDSSADRPWTPSEHEEALARGAAFFALESSLRQAQDEVEELTAAVARLRKRVSRLQAQNEAARAELEKWVPVRQDVTRVGRRVAGAIKRRVLP